MSTTSSTLGTILREPASRATWPSASSGTGARPTLGSTVQNG